MRGANGECGGDRRPVGRRGQGQDRRLAVRARRHRRALPGRPQRRPHARHRQPDLQAGASALRRRAPRQAQRHRQRRRPRSVAPRQRDRRPQAARHRDRSAQPEDRRERHADPAAASRARPAARDAPPPTSASAPPGAASARPTRTRWGAAPSAPRTSRTWARSVAKVDRLLVHHNALRRGLGVAEIGRTCSCAS